MDTNAILKKMVLPREIKEIFDTEGIEIILPESREQLLELAIGGPGNTRRDVSFEVAGKGTVREAAIAKCKNGLVVNFDDIYMRRRDPSSMVIADSLPSDKPTHEERFGEPFDPIREQTFEWLKAQKSLICMPFYAGSEVKGLGYPALLVVPANAAFFALALADLQGFTPAGEIPKYFRPCAAIYVAPPFRHTHYEGKQVVIHNRMFGFHEVFSYNLYPGPSAKKGIYAVLLDIGEQEKWVTLHASTVRVITPYELSIVIMHEGASGSGKSEMVEQFHRQSDGRLLLGTNLVSGETIKLGMSDSSVLEPVTDDMAMCHPSIQNESGRLVVADAESGWFQRVNHITHYGTEPHTERRTVHPEKPLVFLNMDGVPGSTCLIWEPIMDAPGVPCPNPRVIMPRAMVENHVDEPVEINVRSFGLRQPPCTADKPTYGIAGMLQILPPALAWLWRLVAPRGYANPSIITDDTGEENSGLQSEGVGSYWPFSTGKMVDHANLLLDQIVKTPSTRYALIPNQYIGAYQVGFSGQWVAREYVSRRGGIKFQADSLAHARCPLLGYCLNSMKVDGTAIPKGLLQVNRQPEVGDAAYDAGARMLADFFKDELAKFDVDDVQPLGRQIIQACLNDASVEDYFRLIPYRI